MNTQHGAADCGRSAGAIGVVVGMVLWGATLVALIGCDGGGTDAGGGSASYSDAGLVMQLPPRWSVDRSGVYTERGERDHQGTVYLDALLGGSLDAHVSAIEAEGGVVSRDALEIDAHEAIELITEATFTVYDAYIRRGDEVVVVSFRTRPEAFEDQLDAFRAAARSIRFQ